MDLTSISAITASLLFFSLSCARNEPDLSNKSIEEIAQMIHQEVGNARAESADRCDILPIGVKPAGGPWGYIVFSTEQSDRDKLEKLILRYNELDAERNRDNEGFSTADIASKPPVILKGGVCTGEGPYAWNVGDILDINQLPEG